MTNKDSATTPSEATRAAEEAEAAKTHQADRPPTPDEEKGAPRHTSGQTEKHYQEMAERGANVQGEGQVP